jgi:transcriptional/translational regulatory protein YebC/TACO1
MVPLAEVDEDASYAYSDLVEMLLELDDVDTVYTK